jgi:hypothetical protein
MRTGKLVAVVAGLMAIVLAVLPAIAQACAVCGLGPNDTAGHAFNTSVLFMMAVPYATVIIVGGAVYLAWKKAQRRSEMATSVHKS